MPKAPIQAHPNLSPLRIKSKGSPGEEAGRHEGRCSHVMLVDEGDKAEIGSERRLLFDEGPLLQALGLLL